MHDGEVVLRRLRHVEGVGIGGRHQFVVVEITFDRWIVGTSVFIDDDDVSESFDIREDAGDLPSEVRAGNEIFGASVEHSISHGIRSESGEERGDDTASFENAHRGDVELRETVHKDEDSVAKFDPKVLHDCAEAIGFPFELGVGVSLFFTILPDPDHGQFVAVSVCHVPVNSFVRVVQPAAGQPVHVLKSVAPPIEIGAF